MKWLTERSHFAPFVYPSISPMAIPFPKLPLRTATPALLMRRRSNGQAHDLEAAGRPEFGDPYGRYLNVSESTALLPGLRGKAKDFSDALNTCPRYLMGASPAAACQSNGDAYAVSVVRRNLQGTKHWQGPRVESVKLSLGSCVPGTDGTWSNMGIRARLSL